MWPGMGSPSAGQGQPLKAPAPPQTTPGGSISKAAVAVISIDEGKQDLELDRRYDEAFSKGILLQRLKEYYAGKYTKRYIETYLDFCHLSGYISNLDYLDIKGKMSGE